MGRFREVLVNKFFFAEERVHGVVNGFFFSNSGKNRIYEPAKMVLLKQQKQKKKKKFKDHNKNTNNNKDHNKLIFFFNSEKLIFFVKFGKS
jgi:hypothetical protein